MKVNRNIIAVKVKKNRIEKQYIHKSFHGSSVHNYEKNVWYLNIVSVKNIQCLVLYVF